MVKTILAGLMSLLCTVATAETPKAEFRWFKHQGSAMGTLINIEIWHNNKLSAETLMDGVMAEMNRIDQLMSPYIPESELAIINANAFREPVPVSDELYRLINLSLQHGQWSNGAFDITYASVGHQYDYRKHIKPSTQSLKASLDAIDYKSVQLNDNKRTVRFTKPGVKVDLGGIAKGHAVDKAIQYLESNGIRHGIVSAGGDTRLLGDRLGRPWMLGIKHPRGEGHIISLPLENIAVSTSGDYERYFVDQKGVRHHHILNPKSGKSAKAVQSVTILGPNATMTDALSTTVFVMGPKKGLDYINHLNDVSAIIIDAKGKLHYSNDLVRPSKRK